MKSNSKQTKANENQNVNVTKKTKEAKQEPYVAGLFDKPMVERVEVIMPLNFEVFPDGDDKEPTLINPQYYDKYFIVEDQGVYRIRLGIHSCSLGIGAMNKDTSIACRIPTDTAEAHRIFALFFLPEMYPVKLMDAVILQTRKPSQKFRLVYEQGSAVLESNNLSRGLALSHDAAWIEDNNLIIFQHGLHNEIPSYADFTYDFLTFRVRVVFDKK